jgi:hypothetical protein
LNNRTLDLLDCRYLFGIKVVTLSLSGAGAMFLFIE